MRLGLVQQLPYDVILGRDWPEFMKLVREEVEGRECIEGKGGEVNPAEDLSREQR